MQSGGTFIDENSRATLACLASKIDLHLPLYGCLEAIQTGDKPQAIDLFASQRMPDPKGVSAPGVSNIAIRMTEALFSLYAERAVDWVKRNIPTKDWPPTINFSRVVRNAIVHGGTINLNSPTAQGGSWRHLTYGPADAGRRIINVDLSAGDLVVLMLEIEQELNAVGAPFDLG